MSFRLFIDNSAIAGSLAGLLGWAGGRLVSSMDPLLSSGLRSVVLGMLFAGAVALVEVLGLLSLRQRALTLQRLGFVLVLGAVGGFLGGLLGHQASRLSPFVGFVLVWSIAGAMIGASSGLFDWFVCAAAGLDRAGPRRKTGIGLAAGAMGGFAGSLIAFGVLQGLVRLFPSKEPADLWSAEAVSLSLLGGLLCGVIGAMQVRSRTAWLRIEEGSRAGSELLLTRPVLTLGRGDACDIVLPEDRQLDAMHARLEQHGRRFLVVDASGSGGTYINEQRISAPHILRPGDLIRIGGTVLRFHEIRQPSRDAE
jgi:hypothetical protein